MLRPDQQQVAVIAMRNQRTEALFCAVLAGLLCLAGCDVDLLECSRQLEYAVDYPSDLDLPEQRAALLSLYNSTGGPFWRWSADSSQYELFSQLVADVVTYGISISEQNTVLSEAISSASKFRDLAFLPDLSTNCTLQQALSFGQLLLRHDWGNSNQSYCQWHGVTCCKTAGDQHSGYCSAPQSVAHIYLPDMNISGSIPGDIFAALPDLQSLLLNDNPGLVGKLPDFGLDIAAKMSVLRIDNTSLQQCNATSLAVYKDGLRDTTLRVDSSKADNTTGCLLDALVFCEDKSPVDETLECPSLAFRRPAEATPDQLDLVTSMLQVLQDTNSLVQAARNLTSEVVFLTWGTTVDSCGLDVDEAYDYSPEDGGLGRDDVTLVYDPSFFSYAGCRCISGYDNVYTFDETGRVSMSCTTQNHSRVKVIVAATVVPFVVVAALLLLLATQWQRILAELAQIHVNRVKQGNTPGTISANLAQEMGLVHKEVTLVMTDVQASSILWEWDARVMDHALALHDACLRSVLHHHYGYEVATEGDAFTMAFHDPIDAVSWALEVQQRLLQLPWPPELLTQPDAAVQYSLEPALKDMLIFKGLRVRMALHTGRPDAVQAHHVTRQVEYQGDVVSLTEALVGFPAGGQILLSDAIYQRVYGRLHNLKYKDQLQQSTPRNKLGVLPMSAPSTALDAQFAPDHSKQSSLLQSQSAGSTSGLYGLSHALSTAPSAQLLLPGSPQALGKKLTWQDAAAPVWQGPGETENPTASVQDTTQVVGHRQHKFKTYLLGVWQELSKCMWTRKQSNVPRSSSGRLRPLPTDAGHSVQAGVNQKALCELIDMGAFYLAEFAQKQCCPIEGSAVHGGMHVLQVLAPSHRSRLLHFPPLSQTFKVAPSYDDAPGTRGVNHIVQQDIQPRSASFVATIVFCGPALFKELLQQSIPLAQSAMLQFQSCVRTTLLLSNGYECQEKDGLFMIAFSSPRGAVEWALLLQLALLRVEWSPELEQHSMTAEVRASQGQLLFKGLAAKVALVHGSLEKVCPHFSTGRADYFGSTVNRAARLLCAAKSGQILAEAPVMDAVLKEWLGTPPHLPLASRRTKQGCLPDMSQACLVPTADSERDSPASGAAPKASRNRSAPNLMLGFGSNSIDSGLPDLQRQSGNIPGAADDVIAAKSRRSGSLLQPPNKESLGWAKSVKHLASGMAQSDRSSSQAGIDGMLYSDEEVESLQGVTESCCQPFAADSPLAIRSCHMLQFLAQLGRQHARRDVGYSNLQKQGSAAGSGAAPVRSPRTTFADVVARVNELRRTSGSTAALQDGVMPVADLRKKEATRPVWTPSSAIGKPFPTRQVPVEVWGIGAFKFKGIAGHSKVMEVQIADLAERMTLHQGALEAGKAVCVMAAQYRRCSLKIHLLDVLELQLSL